jgi:hypothetical protein
MVQESSSNRRFLPWLQILLQPGTGSEMIRVWKPTGSR